MGTFDENTNRQYGHVLAFAAAGLCPIQIRCDGTKRPSRRWKIYQTRMPTEQELRGWFGVGHVGVGIVCGCVSRGLEAIDFDADADINFPVWYRAVESIASYLPVIETAGGGRHVLYRCDEISPGRKIATDPHSKKQTIVESRGEGNYIVSTLSPLSVHKSGKPYIQTMGPPLPEVPKISPADRRRIWEAARKFDRGSELTHERAKVRGESIGRRVSTSHRWVRRSDPPTTEAEWREVLLIDGWNTSNGRNWVRPGKRDGASASLLQANGGAFLLVVFSTSAGVPAGTHSLRSFMEAKGGLKWSK